MKIKTRLLISAAVFLSTSVIVVAVLVWAASWMEEGFRKQRVYYSLTDKVFALNALSDSYRIYQEERSREQWQWVYQSLTDLLSQVDPLHATERLYLKGLAKQHGQIKPIFEKLALEVGTNPRVKSSDITERLGNQLTTELREMASQASHLFFFGQARLRTIQKDTGLLLLFLVCGMVLLNGVLAFSTGRFISSSLAQLRRGIKTVDEEGPGNRIDMQRKDEIGEVAQAFNEMSASLKESHEALQSENIERMRTAGALAQSRERLQQLASQLLLAQEKERKRVAVELHDGLLSELAAMKYLLEGNLMLLDKGTPVDPSGLRRIADILGLTMKEARRIMNNLHPSVLDELGFLSAMNWLCGEYQKSYPHISVQTEINVSESDISDAIRIVIFRVLQEALNNFTKYGKGDRVEISLSKPDGTFSFVIQDNGQGFDVENAERGLGLESMRERVELSGGTFQIESVIGQGTTIRAIWRS